MVTKAPHARRRAPSERDQQIYRRVAAEQVSQRQAAAEFGLSQPRICKIVARVEKWLVEHDGDHLRK